MMPFGWDTPAVVPSNIGTRPPTGRGDFGVGSPIRSDAAYRKITFALVVTFHGVGMTALSAISARRSTFS